MNSLGSHSNASYANFLEWLSPLGLSARMFFQSMSPAAFRKLNRGQIDAYSKWFGLRGFHLIVIGAAAVSIALTIECVVEMQKYRVQDWSGLVIAIGLLRELGPLTVSLAWCARVAAMLAEEGQLYNMLPDKEFAEDYVLPRYLSALWMAVPLGAYGLVFGFLTGAVLAPLLGVSSANDFLESSKNGIENRDLFLYFTKLILVNPTIGVFAGCASARLGSVGEKLNVSAAANAVTATFLCGYVANAIFTFMVVVFWRTL